MLLTNAELLDDSTVALDVFLFEVVEQSTTLTYQRGQCTLSTEVLAVGFEVLGKVVDTIGEECDLALGGAGVLCIVAVLCEQLSFLFRSQVHDNK